jgi:hypothetical protein
MPISMWVRKEAGERVDGSGWIEWKVPDGALSLRETPLLIAVDPYGNTVFNRRQIERQLPRELALLRETVTDAESAAMFDELERLMAVACERVHRYLWFLGDWSRTLLVEPARRAGEPPPVVPVCPGSGG